MAFAIPGVRFPGSQTPEIADRSAVPGEAQTIGHEAMTAAEVIIAPGSARTESSPGAHLGDTRADTLRVAAKMLGVGRISGA